MIVVVAGATGFIGAPLVAALKSKGHEVRVLARSPEKAKAALGVTAAFPWSGAGGEPPLEALAAADAVVNLAGESIAGGRWTAKRKALLRGSRIDATRNLVRAIGKATPRPRVLINGSAIGYYGDRPDGDLDENAAPGHDFLADLCREWEIAAQNVESLGVRLVTLRTGLVLGKNGGALDKMLLPFKLGAGGKLGSG
ncbi:MAG TPA: NAD-dependent epimerase/dehydratase family protein, partial [bacterium]|nr:NAD-dependent epimerase/dehydratase family protein [bacterium]